MKYGEIKDEELINKIVMLRQIEMNMDYYISLYTKLQADGIREKLIDMLKSEHSFLNYEINKRVSEILKDKGVDMSSVKITFNPDKKCLEIIDRNEDKEENKE